jgi:cyclopropane fatty-acyl-phospholipid synthase-like methyltransferase
MFSTDPSKHWQRWGREDPYFGVLTSASYHRDQMDENARKDFFASGEACIDAALTTVKSHLDGGFAPQRSLDFGCGVGRLTIPLARRSEQVVGVDISPAMLEEARKNADAAGVHNITWVESDDGLTRVTGSFDFIYSIIVFHHIRPEVGQRLLVRQLQMLRPGGVLAAQVLYHLDQSAVVKTARWIQAHVPVANSLVNAVKRRPLSTPNMEANVYPFAQTLELLQNAGIRGTYLELSRENACSHAVVYAQRPR